LGPQGFKPFIERMKKSAAEGSTSSNDTATEKPATATSGIQKETGARNG